MINTSVINESTVMADAKVQAMMGAFQTQWNRDLAPVWDLEAATFTWTAKGNPPPSTSWWVVFLDDSDQASALAYHDVTESGLPLAKVFVRTIQQDQASVSVAATHEICEMAVDPTINMSAQDSGGTFWAYEVSDPVEDDQYGYDIGGVLVSDFVTPAWFGYKNSAGPYDFQGQAKAAFEVLTGGYAQKFGPQGWIQVTGAAAQASTKVRVLKAPIGSRRARRTIPLDRRVRSHSTSDRNQRRDALKKAAT